jgi:rod shape-determining protein MreB
MWLDFLFGSLSKNIGIDLGTSTTLVHIKGKGIVLYEPSVVAFKDGEDRILAVGEEAKKMLGRTPRGIFTVRPLKEGVIADFEVTAEMLKYFIKKVHNPNRFTRPSVVICVPSGVTEVEKRAVSEVAYKCGAGRVFLIDEPIAAAIGVGLPIFEPMGNLVIDVGGGTSEVAIISLGGIVVSELSQVAGDYINETISKYVKQAHNLYIGELTAEEIKALSEPLRIIANTVRMALEKTPPELISDIVDKGVIMTGGGSLLIGLPELLQEEIGIPVFVSPKPVYCVIKGIGKVLENFNLYQRVLVRTSKRI